MITVYSGLCYLAVDVGNEAKNILFIVIVFANAVFVIIWITTYLGNVDWAVSLVKTCLIENQYIEIEHLIPYFPECPDEVAQSNKVQFLRNVLLGHQFYTTDITHKKIQELMKNHIIIRKFYEEMKNIHIQKKVNSNDPERLDEHKFHNPLSHNKAINEQDFSFSKNLEQDSIFMTTVMEDSEDINKELEVSYEDVVNNIPPDLRKKSQI